MNADEIARREISRIARNMVVDMPERARTSLQGLAIGDAFGETLFGDPDQVARRISKRLISTKRPWRWTDDTAMALSIVEILERYSTIDPDALAEAFTHRWVADPDRGYGHGTFELLMRVSRGAPWRQQAQQLFGGQGSFGNGAAMRAGPIGAFFAGDPERARHEALRSAEPTHTHPDGGAGAVAVAVAASLVAVGIEAHKLIPEVIAFVPKGHVLDRLRRAAEFDLKGDPISVGEQLGTGLDVAAHDTVAFCLWVAARHLTSYEDAIWTATSQDGDRDTLGAIVGSIVVLATGVECIPILWRAATEPIPSLFGP